MINTEQLLELFHKYCDSFESFALDMFGLETTADLSSRDTSYVGPEEMMVAMACWNIIFHYNKTLLIATPNARMAHHWHQLVLNALAEIPEEFKPQIKSRHLEISTCTDNRLRFGVVNENLGRGMTINWMTVIEPTMIVPRVYRNFYASIWPVIMSGRCNQIIRYSRGY